MASSTGNRTRQDRQSTDSSSSCETCQHKKVNTKNNSNIYSLLEHYQTSDSDSFESQEEKGTCTDTPKIDTIFKPSYTSTFNMATTDADPPIPTWAKRLKEQLSKSIQNSLQSVVTQLSQKIDDLVDSNKYLEATIEDAAKTAHEAIASTVHLKEHIQTQDNIIEKQAKLIADAEAYSKKYNLKFFNVPESPNETPRMLLDRLHHIFSIMDINLKHVYIDNIHRLPTSGKGPRPIS